MQRFYAEILYPRKICLLESPKRYKFHAEHFSIALVIGIIE